VTEGFLLRALTLIAVVAWVPLSLTAQQAATVANDVGLPDAPGMGSLAGASNNHANATAGSATISGTVLDADGAEIQGAKVVLSDTQGPGKRVVKSGRNGEFTFSGLPSGDFKLAVSGPGWGTVVSSNIHLGAGDFHIIPQIVLPVTISATVRVTANPDELAEEQVQIAEQQRVLGVFPNFYSSYDWNAPPMGSRQKFHLAFRSVFDPVTFVGVAAVAGIEQGADTFPGYGQGVQGYSKRFGAAYANDFIGRMLSQAALPSLFHQDPRYFYKGNGSFHSRALYAIGAAVIARGDNGHWEPNYSHILGSFAAGGLSDLYYPSGDRGATLAVANGLVDIANYAGTNLLREFVLKRFTTRASKETGGQL
jgi:Carboxypeptidase regulatory-like domain